MGSYTEDEAKTKWCPFTRPVFPQFQDCGFQAGNRNYVKPGEDQTTEQTRCIASACMAWREIEYGQAYKGGKRLGYCGLVGKP